MVSILVFYPHSLFLKAPAFPLLYADCGFLRAEPLGEGVVEDTMKAERMRQLAGACAERLVAGARGRRPLGEFASANSLSNREESGSSLLRRAGAPLHCLTGEDVSAFEDPERVAVKVDEAIRFHLRKFAGKGAAVCAHVGGHVVSVHGERECVGASCARLFGKVRDELVAEFQLGKDLNPAVHGKRAPGKECREPQLQIPDEFAFFCRNVVHAAFRGEQFGQCKPEDFSRF